MRFALIGNKRVEAKPKVKALCPGCFQPVIAKCGLQRIHHWAHHNNRDCDTWWEPETEWHRNWKEKFPDEWQENYLRDERTGEKHVADIRTDQGIVIEFQHSHLDPQERVSREKFYRNLVWVIDGTRLKRDFKRFVNVKRYFIPVKPRIFRVDFPEESFPSAWIESSVPVIFDFLGTATSDSASERNSLYCLFPKRIGISAIVSEIPRGAFIKTVIDGQWLSRVANFTNLLEQIDKERQEQLAAPLEPDNVRLENYRRQLRNPKRGRRL